MITLLIDALIAAVKLADRALTAVEKRAQPPAVPLAVDGSARPAGADTPPSSPGGHPHWFLPPLD